MISMVQETDIGRVAGQKPVKRNDMSDMVHRIKTEDAEGRRKVVEGYDTDGKANYRDISSSDD